MKLATKFTLIVIVIIFIFASLSSYVIYLSNFYTLENVVMSELEEVAAHIVNSVDIMMFERFSDIKLISGDSIISKKESTPQMIKNRLNQIKDLNEEYISLSFFDSNSVRIADTEGLDIGKKHPDIGYVKSINLRKKFVMDISLSTSLKKVVLHFAYPVFQQVTGEYIGFVVLRVPASIFNSITKRFALKNKLRKTSIDLADKEGILLFSNNKRKLILKSRFSHFDYVSENVNSHKTGSFKVFNKFIEEKILYAYAKEQGHKDFAGNGWTIFVGVLEKEVFLPAYIIRNRMVIIISGTLFLSLIVVVIFMRKITDSISELKKGAEILGNGQFDYVLKPRSKDEIGQLFVSFNNMALGLMRITDNLNHEIGWRKKTQDALKKSYERYSLAEKTAAIGNFDLNIKEGDLFWSENVLSMFGFSNDKFLGTYEAFLDCVHPEDRKLVASSIYAAINGKVDYRIEHRIVWPDGTIRWMLQNGHLYRNKDDEAVRIMGIVQDVTLRKKAQKELIKRNKELLFAKSELLRSNKELEQFAYIASHDLQEPVRMISSYLNLLKERSLDKLDKEENEFVNYAFDGANRMEELIRALLRFSRVGTQIKNFKVVDTNYTLNMAKDNLQQLIKKKCAEIIFTHLPEVFGDEVLLIQLFQNLINNAIKFNESKKPVINIDASLVKGEWIFSVKDNGTGMDPAYSDKIFIIFKRLHGIGDYEGTGIGLALCRKIVEEHKGRIWFDSMPGQGTTFYFTIPVIKI